MRRVSNIEGRNMVKIDRGQSVTEYVIIFAIVAVLSVVMIANIPGYFKNYVSTATSRMR
jgi:hypothetical protein